MVLIALKEGKVESKNTCWVCDEARTHDFFDRRCPKHDICDDCKKTRSEIEATCWWTLTGFICDKCRQKQCEKKIEDFTKEDHDEFEFNYNDQIKCPYCGYEYNPDDLHEDTDDEECPECNSVMSVVIEYSVTYSTAKLKKEGGEK